MRFLDCRLARKRALPGLFRDGRSVDVRGDRLIKRQPSARSRLERERCAVGTRVAASCGLFDVPDVLSFDDDAGEIVFRFIADAVPLRSYFAANPSTELATRCGQALAHIHLAGSGERHGDLLWHGDYGMGNLLYSERKDRLTIVDWSNAHWAGIPPGQSSGPAGLDIGIAIFSLFHRVVTHRPCILAPERLGTAFLDGYTISRPDFRLVAERPVVAVVHRRWRSYFFARFGLLRTLAVIPSWVQVQRFLFLDGGTF